MNNTCPICKRGNTKFSNSGLKPGTRADCPRCGQFVITSNAFTILNNTGNANDKLSAWIRNRNEQGIEIPVINTYMLDEIIKGLPDYSPREKQLRLLQNLARKSEFPGYRVAIPPEDDVPLAWAANEKEFLYYIESLKERGFIRDEKSGINSIQFHITITTAGWDYLEKHDLMLEERTQAFVAMSFSDEMKPVWDNALKPAIEKAGYKAYRVDVEPHIDRIDAKIISEIKNSRFVVADVTEQKRGAYFEAGYALGMGLPVIWSVQKDDLENVHFDTRQYNYIVWETEERLKEELYNVICAVIGKRGNR